MTLFDVDKNSQDRGTPRPNTHDVLTNRPNYGTLSSNFTTQASNSTVASAIKTGYFRIVGSGTQAVATVTFPNTTSSFGIGGAATITIPHGLSFVPGVLGYVTDANTDFYSSMPYKAYVFNNGGDGGFIFFEYSIEVDATNVYINSYAWGGYTTGSSRSGISVRYYLYQQTAN